MSPSSSCLAVFLFFLVGRLQLTTAVAATQKQSKTQIIRSEGSLTVGAHGEMVVDNSDDVGDATCNDDFELGIPNTNSCDPNRDHGFQEHVTDPRLCAKAARAMNLTASENAHFKITDAWYDVRPFGCFMHPCTEDPKGLCLFFNPNPNPSPPTTGIQGTKICKRPRHLLGANNSANASLSCPPAYQVVMRETDCISASACLDLDQLAPFNPNLVNMSKYNDYPQGCYVGPNTCGAKDRCAGFNGPLPSMLAAGDWTIRAPGRPYGQSICNVTALLTYSEGFDMGLGPNASLVNHSSNGTV